MGVICKFFQQGRCRFGNQCKFQHYDYDDGGGGNVSRPNDQFHFTKPDVNAILQAVKQEIIASEKGKQWPLSCFAPLKEYGNIPGWEDISPEELRWQVYLSRQTGTLDDCIKQIQEVYLNEKMKRNAMLNPTLETKTILEGIFKTDSATNFSLGQIENKTPNTFSSGGFGIGNSFASAQPGTSIFGGSTATGFGAPANTSQSAFNTVATGHSSSIFGGATTATPVQSPSFFGGSAPAASVFGNTSSALTTNVFGNVPSVSPANIFGNTVTPAPGNTFGASHSSSIFGGHHAQQPTAQTFGEVNPPVGQTFGNASQQQTSFFQSAAPPAYGNTNTNTFRSDQVTSVATDGTYTPMNELSEDALAAFKADKFVMGMIPTVPPPRELC